MVKALVHQVQRQHLNIQPLGHQPVGIELGAEAVARPQPAPFTIQQGIASPLKGQFCRQGKHLVPLGLKPVFEEGLFALAFGVEKAAQHHLIAQDQPGVGGKHHIRPALLGLDQINIGAIGNDLVEILPLLLGRRQGCTMNVTLHPGVDHIVHLVVVGGAHEKANGGGHRKRLT